MQKTILEYRIAAGLTQEEIANGLGISNVAYSLYENGKRKVPYKYVDQIMNLLKIPKEEKEKIFLPATFAICKGGLKD